MLVEAARHAKYATPDLRQIVEVERAFLPLAEFRHDDGVNRSPDNRGLDKRAGVQRCHRSAVVQRLEIVLLRAIIDRKRTVERHIRKVRQVDLVPLLQSRRVRTHQDGRRPQQRIVAGPDFLNPLPYESSLGWCVRVERRAGIQQKRSVGGKLQHFAELLPRASRHAVEPLVVALRADDDQPFRWYAVQFHRFAYLGLVPHQHPVRHLTDSSLTRKVIPTSDAEYGSGAERPGAAQHVDLP